MELAIAIALALAMFFCFALSKNRRKEIRRQALVWVGIVLGFLAILMLYLAP